jgi:serine/threonine-protein phosphatase 5
LDWKEEAALMNTHGAFEQLKAAVKKADAEGTGAKKGARSSSPAPGKGKKRRSSLTDHEEAAALGLVWRDKDPLTMVWIEQMMDTFKRNHQLPVALVLKLLKQVTPLLRELPNIVQVPVSARVTVVGDLHGQLDDLLAIFKLQGLPSARNRMIFNGDFVDRGQWSCECILTLLAWKLLLPHDVLLNRGNHEARDINGRDGFEKECLQKYGKRGAEVFDAFSACFAALPLVHIIEQQVFVVHGGLCSRSVTLDEIAAIDRFHEIPPDDSLFCDLLWSDPKPGKGRSESPRGAGLLFGPDVTADFFKRNPPLNLIVRSHECMTKGFKLHHNGTVITVFSASNYTGTVGNDGALIVFERDGGTVLGTAAATAAAANKHPPPSPRGPRAHGAPSSESASSSAAAPSSPAKSLRTRQKHEVHLTVPASVAAAAAASGVVPLKRSIVTFYAAKKEKSASYRITPDSHLQTDIVAKLLHLISDHRLSLINFWSSKAKPHSSGVATITRAEWAAGLKSCLGLNHLPFQELWVQEMLGLPKLGVDGKAKGQSLDVIRTSPNPVHASVTH